MNIDELGKQSEEYKKAINDEINFEEALHNIKIQIEETETEFIYTAITPFSETVTEKHLSKEELKAILRRGMQPSVPVDRLKRLRNEAMTMNDIAVIQMLDKLIAESEDEYDK